MEEENKVVSLSGKREKAAEKHSDKEEKNDERKEAVYCSFCKRPNHQVVKMINGPGVNICSECAMVCVQYFILEDKVPSSELTKILDLLWGAVPKK